MRSKTRPIQWRVKAAELIEDGELEVQKGRALATGAVTEFISEIMDELAENPDLQEFVQDLVGQQGVGLATSAVDNARSVALTADDAAEGLIRWLFRRTPRRELPSSPVEGIPQTMYMPKVRLKEKISMTIEHDSTPVILGRYAGFFSRAAAFAIDRAIVFGIAFVILVVVQYFINLLLIDDWLASFISR